MVYKNIIADLKPQCTFNGKSLYCADINFVRILSIFDVIAVLSQIASLHLRLWAFD